MRPAAPPLSRLLASLATRSHTPPPVWPTLTPPPARRAPLRPTECGDEERAVVACEPRTDAKRCAGVIAAYDACARGVTAKLMYPLR